ncbi:hypothetical protein SAMN04487846_1362 [Microbacterium sp. cf046]|uniref:hypothetical protein n=1 Tax=Microbacterium sp. cf046 TaxID=1761803 RepID=UPI0008EBBDEF|nr:hypothetical protein [Microbacterium sp. cf046]SFS00282.1 hypothetical protein SAMN04487846_1362 [Microbacterium sp. cf046]
MSTQPAPRSFTVLSSLKWPAIAIGILAVVGGVVGYLVSGVSGLVSGLLGAAMWLVFLALTSISIQVATRATKDDPGSPLFFGIVLGSWVLKLVLFVVLSIWLRAQPWLDPTVFFVTVIIAVVGSLVFDVIAFQRARVPYVGDVELPRTVDDDAPDGAR